MTARYNIFKDNTPCTEPSENGLTIGTAQTQADSKLGAPPMMRKHYPNSVVNEPNMVRGHDVSGGRKDGY